MLKLQMNLNWKDTIQSLNDALIEMPNIMDLTLNDSILSELEIAKLPNLMNLRLVNCIVDVDVYQYMHNWDRLMDIELINCTKWMSLKKSMLITKCVMSGIYAIEDKQVKRLTITYCSQMDSLIKEILTTDELLIKNVQSKNLMNIPLKHLKECVLMNVQGENEDVKVLLDKLPNKFYFNMGDYTVHSQDAIFKMVTIKQRKRTKSIHLDKGTVRISSKSDSLDAGNMIPVLLSNY